MREELSRRTFDGGVKYERSNARWRSCPMRSSFSEAMRGGGVVPCVRRSAKQCEVEELSNAFVVQRAHARRRRSVLRAESCLRFGRR